MPVTADQFAKTLLASGLSTADEIKTFWSSIPPGERPKDGETFAAKLIAAERLNKFQAEELLSGSQTPLVLGDYVLLGRIGAGGMGQVFKAHHRHMKRLVAIKLLPKDLTKDEEAIKRFQREVQAAAKLSHPNIVQAHDASMQKGVWYLVMEYVEGRDLAGVVTKEGPLPIERAVDYMRQAAKGLAFAHENGVVHRDIKPANLLLDKKGVVKILDMGLARIDENKVTAQEGLTQSGQVMGTVDYMAPEQAFNVSKVDGRADIYSLGCTLYRLLTGRNLFDGESMVEKLMAHQTKPIPKLAAIRPDAPASLVSIFEKMVAKLPDDRYKSMADVEAALAAFLSPPSPQSPAPSPSFFQSLTGGKPAAAVKPKPVAPPVDGTSPTVSLQQAHVTTDPVSERSIQVVRENTPRPFGGKSKTKLPLLIGGGLAAVLLLLGIWVIIRDKDGNEVAKIKVPDGGTATIESPSQTPLAPARGEGPGVRGNPPPIAQAPFDAAQAKAHQEAWAKHLGTQVETINSVGQKMILIPPGEFLMGSTDEQVEAAVKTAEEENADQKEKDRISKNERPQHQVVITKPFLMGATEVTVGQFKKFTAATGYQTEAEKEQFQAKPSPSATPDQSLIVPKMIPTYLHPSAGVNLGYVVTDDLAAGYISWNDAVAYCEWLSEKEKTNYRLPTEAEWEYACRAGTTTLYSFGDDHQQLNQYARYLDRTKSAGTTHLVGTKFPNAFGLFDMHGNMQEWCQDYFDQTWYEKSSSNDPHGPVSGSLRVIRGGSQSNNANFCRSAYRYGHSPSNHSYLSGFHCVRELTAPSSTASVTPSTPPLVTPRPVAKPVDPAPPLAKAPFTTAQAKAHQEAWAKHLGSQVETVNSVGQKMILIPPGEFLMGSSDEQVAAAIKIAEVEKADAATISRIEKAERPQHKVVITQPFLLGQTEVTVGQFKKFAAATGYQTEAEKEEAKANAAPPPKPVEGQPTVAPKAIQTYLNPGYPVEDDFPATLITWNDAAAYCNWLSEQEQREPSYRRDGNSWNVLPGKKGYRLPTEAEWEYACRAGTTTQFSFGNDSQQFAQYGWYKTNSGSRAHGVAGKLPNPFGLYDMYGNAWEWCQDWYDEKWYEQSPPENPTGPLTASYRVIRGGGWTLTPAISRSSFRSHITQGQRNLNSGFRLSLEFDRSPPPAVTPAPRIAPSSTSPQPAFAVIPFDAAAAKAHQEAWGKYLGVPVETKSKVGIDLVLIPAAGKSAPNSYYIGKYEITQAQYQNVMGYNPSFFKSSHVDVKGLDTSNFPVEQVNWFDAVEFCNKLSVAEGFTAYYELTVTERKGTSVEKAEVKIVGGKGYHLPTDPEWEHACRAGVTTQYHFGNAESELGDYAWFQDNSEKRPHNVGEKKPNGFGLYDMHGNVREWNEERLEIATTNTAECLHRGGNWYSPASHCPVGHRTRNSPANRLSGGLRIARVP